MEAEFAFPYFSLLSGVTLLAPDIKVITGFVLLAGLLWVSAVMSASEVAFFSLGPEDIEKLKNDKSGKSKHILKLYEIPERLLSTILVANNVANVTIVILSAYISSKLFDFSDNQLLGFIIQVVIITFLLLFFGEVLPKVYATRNHLTVTYFMASTLLFLEKLFRPVTSLLIISSTFVKKRTGTRHTRISMDDLSDALDLASSDDLDEDEKILKGIVNFGNINVSAIMCPRIDVTAVDIKDNFSEIMPVIINSGFSRIPVYSETFDNVKGVLYAKDVLPYMNNPGSFKWQSLLRPPYFVPETKKINDLLKEFQVKKIHMAIVIDEYGGTSGLITLEDVLEEIVGEITDESDDDKLLYRKIDDTTFIIEGKMLLNDLVKLFELEEDTFDYVRGESETLAGLILELTGEIPPKDKTIRFRNFTFMVESADRRRIKEVRVLINKEDVLPENE